MNRAFTFVMLALAAMWLTAAVPVALLDPAPRKGGARATVTASATILPAARAAPPSKDDPQHRHVAHRSGGEVRIEFE